MKTPLAALFLALAAAGPAYATAAPPHASPEPTVKPASIARADQGFALVARHQPAAAADQFESALAVDPTNRRAYIGLAETARAQGLPGKAVRYYREALALEPNDLDALSGQAQALAERGATARASLNVARIERLCGAPTCPPAVRARAAIASATLATRTAANTPAPVTNPATPKTARN